MAYVTKLQEHEFFEIIGVGNTNHERLDRIIIDIIGDRGITSQTQIDDLLEAIGITESNCDFDEIAKWVGQVFKPEEVFSTKVLEDWAEKHGYVLADS